MTSDATNFMPLAGFGGLTTLTDAVSDTPALNAESMSLVRYVGCDVRMPVRTVSLGSLASCAGRSSDATLNVLAMSYWLKMVGPDTSTVATEMIEFESFWNHTIDKTMGCNQFRVSTGMMTTSPEHAVASDVTRANPYGAAVSPTGIDMSPEALLSGKLGSHLNLHSGVTRSDARTSRPLSIVQDGEA